MPFTYYLTDNFTGTVGTPITSHTSDSGDTWTVTFSSSTPALDGSGSLVSPTDSGGFATLESSAIIPQVAIFEAKIAFTTTKSWQFSFFPQYSATPTYYQVSFAYSTGTNNVTVSLYNTFTLLASSTITTPASPVIFAAEMTSGDKIVYVNGVEIIRSSDVSAFGAAPMRVNMNHTSNPSSVLIDYITVSDLGVSPTPFDFWTTLVGTTQA